jgi:hypothetical protein
MSRFKAAGMHLLLSCLIAFATICVMIFVWYPPPLFALMGGVGLLLLIALCDVVIGPILTLAVFKSGKKGLKFDLSVIAALQFGALVYGVFVMANARPAFIVFVKDQFALATVTDIDPTAWKDAKDPLFQHAPLAGPEVIGAIPPESRDERENVEFLANIGVGLQQMPRYYVPFERVAPQAGKAARDIKVLKEKNRDNQALIDRAIADAGLSEGQVGFLPVSHRRGTVTALVRRESGTVLKLIDINPDS